MYQVNERVECIEMGSNHHLVIGTFYYVLGHNRYGNVMVSRTIGGKNVGDTDCGFYETRFKRAGEKVSYEQNKPYPGRTWPTPFKVGQQVQVSEDSAGLGNGSLCYVAEVPATKGEGIKVSKCPSLSPVHAVTCFSTQLAIIDLPRESYMPTEHQQAKSRMHRPEPTRIKVQKLRVRSTKLLLC